MLTTRFGRAPGLLQAKRHAARRRRWYAFLRSQRATISVPPKYISTRWTIWRDFSEWWVDNWNLFKQFFQKETARYKEGKCQTTILTVLGILEVQAAEMKASTVFAVEHTDALCTLINETQTRSFEEDERQVQ